MAITSSRSIVNIKEGHFQHDEDARVGKYTLADELPEKIAKISLRPRTMAALPAYTIRRLTVADKKPVLQFLERFFFRDEPMNKAVQLLETPESRCVELEEYASSSLDDGVSLAAVDDNGDFVGVSVNGLAVREEAADAVDKSSECSNAKFRKILRLLMILEREAGVWEYVPKSCDKILEIRIVSTHSAWRGRGLMKALCEESERLCREKGGSAMRMDTTSAFSALAAERLHYSKIYAKPFADIPGAPQPEAPHLESRVYVKIL